MDLETMKSTVQKNKATVRKLESEIDSLELKIAEIEPSSEKVKKAVTSMVLKAEDFKSFTELQGNIISSDAVMLSAEMGGRITSLKIDEGDYVQRGAVVGTVDMETTRKSIQEVETSLELANTVFERQQKLWDQKIGSEIQYLQAKNNKERLEKSLITMRSQLAKESIISPMSGYVDIMMLKAGETTAPGAPIASIINTNTVKAVIDVPENMVSKVKKGDKVNLYFPALDMEKVATINMIGRSINSANRTFKVEIDLANSNNVLKPNLLVLAKFNDETIKNAIAIPTELVQQDVSGTSFVYIIAQGEDGQYVQKNEVKTSIGYDGKIVVESGLSDGDQIIVRGARGVAVDDLVEIKNDLK